ncbi:MAG TPA: glycosyl hydrolase 108 family protein [Immundisolibacter sp.]|nr:glycosyl hydrolase 108 family protein [Immundisolibacter sp.]
MADFDQAFDKTVRRWEGFALTDAAGDHGGQTYAGISRRFWPGWAGWGLVDAGKPVPGDLVRAFYREQFWGAVQGDALVHQDVAEIIFDWAVNAGLAWAVPLVLEVLRLRFVDGLDGSMKMALPYLNTLDSPRLFVCEYALRRVAHRLTAVKRDATQAKWLKGWLARDLFFALGDG